MNCQRKDGRRVSDCSRRACVGALARQTLALVLLTFTTTTAYATEATPEEVATFWGTVFNGAPPYGVPPLAALRSNPRVVDGVMVWDVRFDSYRDPDTNLPLRIGGFYAVPTGTPPGPGGTWPGFVVTHSVGGCSTCNSPGEGLPNATYYANKGYATLSFFLRGYAPSTFADPNMSANTSRTAFCENMVGDGQMPFDTAWTGYAVDLYQAAEFVSAQPEVWVAEGLRLHGHSLGGYASAIAPTFSPRYRVIAASSPPTSAADVPASFIPGNPIAGCLGNLPGNPATNLQRAIRMTSFMGTYQAVNSAQLMAINPAWRFDNTEVWFYGGELDTAVRTVDVEALYLKADASNNKAMHLSPIGGHGGAEQWYRSQAWFDGHYPGTTPSPPTARMTAQVNGLTVTFDGRTSTDDRVLVAWDWDFGDGVWQNTGDTVSHTYTTPGMYVAALTVTDGSGLRSTANLPVTVGGMAVVDIVAPAAQPVLVPEGSTAAFDIRLSAPPGRSVTVNVVRQSGDTDLDVAGATSFSFDDGNYNVPQPVTLAAAQDADAVSGAATFSLSATGLVTRAVTAKEIDNDAAVSLGIGDGSGAALETVEIPVTMVNSNDALIAGFTFTVVADASVVSTVSARRGGAVPDAASWSFSAVEDPPGTLTVTAAEFIAVEGVVVAGEVAVLSLTIANGAAPGMSALGFSAVQVDGATVGTTMDGSLTVTGVSLDGGQPDAAVDDGGIAVSSSSAQISSSSMSSSGPSSSTSATGSSGSSSGGSSQGSSAAASSSSSSSSGSATGSSSTAAGDSSGGDPPGAGCTCSVPGGTTQGGWGGALALLLWLRARQRRRPGSNTAMRR